ncbi:hypothetical protein [Streptomyces sp. GS7]|uniref:hypothetical protein n=1 Tax=Streptomyces sp. GS7 TaxID=2692234 RepID=UPI0013195462|nr:hypothetical protein [Streptomyces sp. GS7]QHC24569.1 hypothetical protein GR130_27555 [Streptomyces sp. GS7]
MGDHVKVARDPGELIAPEFDGRVRASRAGDMAENLATTDPTGSYTDSKLRRERHRAIRRESSAAPRRDRCDGGGREAQPAHVREPSTPAGR